jgi:hypothetical protein
MHLVDNRNKYISMSGLKIFLKQVSKHVPFRTLLRHDSQQTEKMWREIQNPELLLTQVRFSTEQSNLVQTG